MSVADKAVLVILEMRSKWTSQVDLPKGESGAASSSG
jgi:hypothetical protein